MKIYLLNLHTTFVELRKGLRLVEKDKARQAKESGYGGSALHHDPSSIHTTVSSIMEVERQFGSYLPDLVRPDRRLLHADLLPVPNRTCGCFGKGIAGNTMPEAVVDNTEEAHTEMDVHTNSGVALHMFNDCLLISHPSSRRRFPFPMSSTPKPVSVTMPQIAPMVLTTLKPLKLHRLINLISVVVTDTSANDAHGFFSFEIESQGRVCARIETSSEAQKNKWVKLIRKCALEHIQKPRKSALYLCLKASAFPAKVLLQTQTTECVIIVNSIVTWACGCEELEMEMGDWDGNGAGNGDGNWDGAGDGAGDGVGGGMEVWI